MNHLLFRCSFALILVTQLAAPARAQLADASLPYVPSQANVAAWLDVQGLLSSPLGVERNWATKHEQAYLDGSLTIPPWVSQLVRASHFTPGRRGEDWSVAFAPLDDPGRLDQIAATERTEIQTLQDKRVVMSQRYGGYFAELAAPNGGSPGLLGIMTPASRQDTRAWLAAAGGGRGAAEYLREQLQEPAGQVVLAIDMDEMLDPAQVRYRLDGAASIRGNDLAKSALVLDFQSLSGVCLSVKATNALTTTLRLDFKRELGKEAEFIKPLVLELLADAGAEIEDFANSQVKVTPYSVSLNAPLSDVGFRKILSLITTPHPSSGAMQPQVAATTPPPAPAPGVKAPPATASASTGPDMVASQRYYYAVIKNLEDLEKTFQARNPSYARSASWHRSYADRIDRLPTQGVHPELQDFAHSMSHSLRVLSDSLNGSNIEMKKLDSKIIYQREYRYQPMTGFEWWWGPPRTPYGYVATPENTQVIEHTNIDQVRQAQQEAAAKGDTQRQEIWADMASQRDVVQQHMVETFGRTFLMQ